MVSSTVVLRWELAQLLSRLSLARCTQTVCWLIAMFAGMASTAAGSAVDVHPAARRDMFDDKFGLQEAVSALDRLHASPDRHRVIPQDGDGLRVSRLVVDIWVVSCEMQREWKTLDHRAIQKLD